MKNQAGCALGWAVAPAARVEDGLEAKGVSEESVWRTWKPYAAFVVAIAAAVWWYNSQSSFAKLNDGKYNCTAVFVNADGKYEVLTDESGQQYAEISATVHNGRLASLTRLTQDQVDALTVRKSGTSHFHATDDPVLHSYNAAACDYSE